MKHPNSLLSLARTNRKSATPAERKMWSILKMNKMGVAFRKQHQIGDYIVDFVCLEKKLIIECDGSQHVNSQSDVVRTEFLEKEGYRILRFWNNDILYHIDGVYLKIQEELKK